jgi:hypothetical protein
MASVASLFPCSLYIKHRPLSASHDSGLHDTLRIASCAKIAFDLSVRMSNETLEVFTHYGSRVNESGISISCLPSLLWSTLEPRAVRIRLQTLNQRCSGFLYQRPCEAAHLAALIRSSRQGLLSADFHDG